MAPLRSFLVFALCVAHVVINAQDLILTKGNRTKDIKIGKFIYVLTSNSEGIFNKYNFELALGDLVSVDGNSITLLIYSTSDIVSEGQKLIKEGVTNYIADSLRVEKSFPKSEIKELALLGKHKGSVKDRKQLKGIGSAVIATGVLVLILGTTSSDPENGGFYIAGGMILGSAGMIALANPNKIKTSNDLRKKKNKEHWKIQ